MHAEDDVVDETTTVPERRWVDKHDAAECDDLASARNWLAVRLRLVNSVGDDADVIRAWIDPMPLGTGFIRYLAQVHYVERV